MGRYKKTHIKKSGFPVMAFVVAVWTLVLVTNLNFNIFISLGVTLIELGVFWIGELINSK